MLLAIERGFTRIITWMAVSFFVAGTVLYLFQILSRLIFQNSFFWIDAFISYLFTLAALMGAALAVKGRENIKIDIFHRYAQRPWVRLMIDGFSSLITIALFTVFFFHTDNLFSSDTYSTFGVPEWILNIPYLLLFSGSLIYYVNLLREDIRDWRDS